MFGTVGERPTMVKQWSNFLSEDLLTSPKVSLSLSDINPVRHPIDKLLAVSCDLKLTLTQRN